MTGSSWIAVAGSLGAGIVELVHPASIPTHIIPNMSFVMNAPQKNGASSAILKSKSEAASGIPRFA